MKKSDSQDSQKVSDLLKKLQASYLGKEEKPVKKKKAQSDEDDRKFREKLAAMLGKATSAKKNEASEEAVPVMAQDSEEISTPEESFSSPSPLPVEEPIIEEPKVSASKPKKRKEATKKEAQTKQKKQPVEKKITEEPIVKEQTIEEPIVEELTIEKPTIEDPIVEEPIVEEPTVEEPTIEEPIIEEPTIEEPIIEEPIIEEPIIEEPIIEEPIIEEPLPTVEEAPAVVIKPKAEAQPDTKPREPENKQTQPIRIVSNVTLPRRSDAPDFAKKEGARDPDSIVIRPRASGQPKAEAIVIRPRGTDKPKPTPEIQKEEISSTPIKIGKEVKPETERDPVPTRSETPKPIMKKEPNTTFVPPTPIPEAEPIKIIPQKTAFKQPASEKEEFGTKKKPNVTIPRSKKPIGKDTPEADKPTKRKMRRVINSIPVTTLEDDSLEEVLDEDLTENEVLIEEIPLDEPEEIAPSTEKPSIFERRKKQKQKQAEEELSALEVVRRRSGLSEDDLAMIFELGYENELGRLVGYENLKRLKTEHLKRVSQTNRHHYRTAFGYRGEEYAGRQQHDTVMAAYIHDRKKLILRLFFTAFLSLVLLFVEMPQLIGGTLLAPGTTYPYLLPIAGVLLLGLTAALSWRQIVAGLRKFLRFEPTPYTVPALLAPIAMLYSLLALFTTAPMLQVNFLTSLAFLVMTVCDVLRLSCEMRTLQILSAEGEKHVLASAVPRKKKLRQGDKIVKIVNDDIGENRYQVRTATETVGFFRRFNDMKSAARPFSILILAVLGLATVVAFVDAVCTSSITSALSAFMTVLMLGAPLSSCFGFFYPLSRANRLLSKRNCALVGEEAIEEYDAPKTLIFRDTSLYTAQKCTEIAVREGDDFRNDLRVSSILFRKLGGTLEPLGQSVPATQKTDPPVSVVRIQDNGVEAMVDNRYHILVGSAEFLRRGGVRVPKESTDKELRRTANVSLMYVAIDGVLKLSYEIEYHTKPTFENLIRDLADTGASIAVWSYDPNLSDSFLQKSRAENAEPVRTVKPNRFEEDMPLDIADTGAVALGKDRDIVYPLHAAAGIGMIRRFGLRMQLIATLLGGAAVAILSLLGQSGLFGIAPIAVYQAFWILVTAIATRSELNPEKLHLR